MDRNRHSQDERDTYLRDLGDTHFLNVHSGIYKPNSCKPTKTKRESPGARQSSPLFVVPAGDGCMIGIAAFSAMVAFATLFVVGIYTYASYGQWEQMRQATKATQTAADAAKSSAITADATLKASQQQFRLEQRPYIWATPQQGATDKQNQKTFLLSLPGERYQIAWAIKIKTGGRSPAKDEISTNSETHFVEKTKFIQEVRNFVPHYPKTIGDTMPPDVSATVGTGPWMTFSKEQYTTIVDGTWIVYVIGAVKYRDIFEPTIAPYETRYCFAYLPTGLPIGTCSDGNTMR